MKIYCAKFRVRANARASKFYLSACVLSVSLLASERASAHFAGPILSSLRPQVEIAAVSAPDFGTDCATLLSLQSRLKSLSLRSLQDWTLSEWVSFTTELKTALEGHPDIVELEQRFVQGQLRQGPSILLKKQGPLPRMQVLGHDGKAQSLPIVQMVDWGFLENHWIPKANEILESMLSKRSLKPALSAEDREALRISRSQLSNQYRRMRKTPISTSNSKIPDVTQVEELVNLILSQTDPLSDLKILHEADRNPEAFANWLGHSDLWNLPFLKTFLDQDSQAKVFVEVLGKGRLRWESIQPNNVKVAARLYERLRPLLDHFFSYILTHQNLTDVRMIEPRKKSNGDSVFLFDGFQIQVFRSYDGEIEKLRFRLYSPDELEALGTRQSSYTPPKPKEIRLLETFEGQAAFRTPKKSARDELDAKWRNQMKSFSDRVKNYLGSLKQFVGTDQNEFLFSNVLPLLLKYSDVLDSEFGSRIVLKVHFILKHPEAEGDLDPLEKIEDLLKAKRELLRGIAEEDDSSSNLGNGTPVNGNSHVELPDEFKTNHHQLEWDVILKVFEKHGWRVSRRHETHWVLEYHDTSHTIVLVYYGREYPTAFARTHWRQGQRLVLNGSAK